MESGLLLRLVGLINLILILSYPVNIQGREFNLVFHQKNYVGVYSDTYRPISFKRGRMIDTTKLYSLIAA